MVGVTNYNNQILKNLFTFVVLPIEFVLSVITTIFFFTFKIYIMQNVVVIFSAPDFTAKDYDQIWDDLRAAGQSNPQGLISHVGFARPEGGWMVVDVWQSEADFNEFGKTLMSIFQKNGSQVPPPKVIPAHYVLVPQHDSMHA